MLSLSLRGRSRWRNQAAAVQSAEGSFQVSKTNSMKKNSHKIYEMD